VSPAERRAGQGAAAGTSGADAARRRLFFALWPDAGVRAALAELAASVALRRGRRVGAERLHLTLVFLGAVDAPARARAEQAAGEVRGTRFELRLERLGHWARSRVAWSAPRETPAALIALVTDLRARLERRGFAPERRPYRAHVTLARDAGRIRGTPHAPVRWPVEAFHLVESVTAPAGAGYRVVRSWPLAAAPARP